MKSQLLRCGSFFWPSINKAIEEVVCQCETYTQFQSQNVAVPLTPTPTPSCPWQMCATDIFMLEGVDYLVVSDSYSEMIFIPCLPPGQSNANKVVLLLKEMFSEHGIPKVLCSENGPQYASAQFTDFCISWGITHKTSSLHYPQSKGFTKACIKSVKHALQWAKYSDADPQLTLLPLQTTPINTKLSSPAELLYQCWLRTTIPAKICNHDPSSIKSVSRSAHALKPPNHRPTNAAKHLCHCMVVNHLWCMTPSERFGFLLLWYMSYHGTAIKYVPAMVPHTTTHGDTSVNAVSKQSTLSQVAQLPHHRLWLNTTSQWHNLHCPQLHRTCSPHPLHLQHWQPRWTRLQLFLHTSCSKECTGTNTCDIPCHTCAATKIQPCLHGTQTPDSGNLRTLNLHCPQILLL